jgi:aspartate racemase
VKTIGLIGGMSWASTAIYYQKLNQYAASALGGLHSAKIQLHSFDFADIAILQSSNRWQEAGALIAEAAQKLEASGSEIILICTNTMHKVIDQVTTRVPVLHIGDCVAAEARKRGIKRVGLLATRFTMEESFYAERLESGGLKVVIPSEPERIEVHRIIFEELCKGVVKPESKTALLAVTDSLRTKGIDGLILGCTELGMAIQQEDFSDLAVLDSTEIHCRAASAFALTKN